MRSRRAPKRMFSGVVVPRKRSSLSSICGLIMPFKRSANKALMYGLSLLLSLSNENTSLLKVLVAASSFSPFVGVTDLVGHCVSAAGLFASEDD